MIQNNLSGQKCVLSQLLLHNNTPIDKLLCLLVRWSMPAAVRILADPCRNYLHAGLLAKWTLEVLANIVKGGDGVYENKRDYKGK